MGLDRWFSTLSWIDRALVRVYTLLAQSLYPGHTVSPAAIVTCDARSMNEGCTESNLGEVADK